MLRRAWVFAAVGSLVGSLVWTASSSYAQSPGPDRSGFSANGRHFGYVPAHEKLDDLQKRAVKRQQPTLAEPPAAMDGQVVPASWSETTSSAEGVVAEGPVLGDPSGELVPWADGVVVEEGDVPSAEAAFPEMASGYGEIGAACGEVCRRPPWIWARAEYLFWSIDGMSVPALATTSPADTPRNQAGVLGQAGTEILFGNGPLHDGSKSGGRFTIGTWFDPCASSGLEVTYFALGEQTETFAASSDDLAILARPFFNVVTGLNDVRLIAFPNLVEGNLSLAADSEFRGLEVLIRRDVATSSFSQTAMLLGYRWVQLNDGLLIEEFTESLDPLNAGTTFDLFDQFDSTNDFHGLDMGLSCQFLPNACYRSWSLELLGKVAVGTTRSSVRIDGHTTETAPDGAIAERDGGLLAQPTNIGTFDQNEFAMVYEGGLTLRREFRSGLELSMGYSLLYWNNVARAGEQIDLGVNPTQIVGPLVGAARPEFVLNTTGFLAQGLHFGVKYSF